MTIYFITFFASICFFILAAKFKTKNKKLFYIFSTLGVLVPCVLAALRDTTIGTDVKVYAEPWFYLAKNCSSFSIFMQTINCSDALYMLFIYYSGKYFGNLSTFFFLTQLLNIVPLVIALNKYDKKINVPIAMIIYFLFFYNMSFNLMRQSIALSFFLLGFVHLLNGKTKKYFIFLLIAFLFHSSAILGVFVYLIYKFSKSKLYLIYNTAFITALLLILVNFESSIIKLVELGVLSTKYLNYVTTYLNEKAIFDWFSDLFFIVVFVLTILFTKKSKEENHRYFIIMQIAGFITYQFGIISNFTQRSSYYFIFPAMFFMLPQICKFDGIAKKNNVMKFLILLMVMIIYWWFRTVHLGYHDTYPFIFA